jgi:hypothetical protein
MYDDREFLSLAPGAFEVQEFTPSTLCFNVTRQCVDTLTAKIAKNRPLPKAVTNGGNWKQKRRAKRLSKFFDGQFDQSRVWQTLPLIVRDAALFGTGITHNFREGNKIVSERVFPWELRLDPKDAEHGTPRVLYFRRWYDKDVLIEKFPDFAEEIEVAKSPSDEIDMDEWGNPSPDENMVLVVECWHLRSGEEASDGKHAICIPGTTLFYESYDKDYFPFTVLRYSHQLAGFFGTGLAHQLAGIQYEINSTAQQVQEAHYIMGTGVIFVDNNSDVETDTITNGRGMIVRYTNVKPEWHNPQPVHPDTYSYMLSLIPKAYEMTGISQMAAQSQNPLGKSASGAALAQFNDIETERFVLFGRSVEDFCIELAWQFYELAEEVYAEDKSYVVKAGEKKRGQHVLSEVKYADVKMDRDSFTLRVFPTSLLSQTPALRRAEVESWANAGWISREEAFALLDMPDTDRFLSLVTAARETVEEIVDRILDADLDKVDGDEPEVYVYPEPTFNLQLCLSMGMQMYLDARLDGCPTENLTLLSQWLEDVRAEIEKLKPPAPANQLVNPNNAGISPSVAAPGVPAASPEQAMAMNGVAPAAA